MVEHELAALPVRGRMVVEVAHHVEHPLGLRVQRRVTEQLGEVWRQDDRRARGHRLDRVPAEGLDPPRVVEVDEEVDAAQEPLGSHCTERVDRPVDGMRPRARARRLRAPQHLDAQVVALGVGGEQVSGIVEPLDVVLAAVPADHRDPVDVAAAVDSPLLDVDDVVPIARGQLDGGVARLDRAPDVGADRRPLEGPEGLSERRLTSATS